MRILVEFTDPSTKEQHQLEMEGPEMDANELKEMVQDTLKEIIGQTLPKDFNLKISEIASGTIH